MRTNSKPSVHGTQPRQALFAKVPLEWGPKWDKVREFSRGIAHRLHALCVGTGRQPPGLELDDEEGWASICCGRLQMHAEDRRNGAKALLALRAAGLVVFDQGYLRVLATRADYDGFHRPLAPVFDPSSTSLPPLLGPSYTSLGSVTVENDSTHTSQIRIEEIRIEERETRAREDTPPVESEDPPLEDTDTPFAIGHRLMLEITGWQYGHHHRRELEDIGSRPEVERLAVIAYLTTPSERDYMRKNPGVVDPEHVVRKWLKYARGRPGLRNARSAPAVDVDAPRYAKTLERLRAELVALRARIRATARDSWERHEAENQEADLLSRIARLQALAA